ncbi:hypothetical protein EDB81DRAFT_849377 [Dactylonectria macrodidyma]|uniref:GH64 domain-containing protein n=1 Tax=Dactylonectria macrodidyma TaxID=307937 RepID=A0A9P9CYJ0_9HYPO|nr:hypothetical protein EDB81DRAFT_849377 [Dactylonectria macrodidyma]
MKLVTKDGRIHTTAGLEADAVIKICDDLVEQRKIDNFEWTSLCIADTTGKPIRVLSPGNQYDTDPSIFASYWKTYVDKVWERYTTQDLMIDTQSKAGIVKCRVVDHKLKCEGHDRGLHKPNDRDIWGCNSGPFAISENASLIHTAIVPRVCAGLASYYTVNPTNHYSRIVHSYEVDGRGYAFSYDDVNPDNHEDASGVVSSDNVQLLIIHAGGPLSESSL